MTSLLSTPLSILGLLMISLSLTAQNDDVTFNILNGDFQRCVEDSLVRIEIVPNPNRVFTLIRLVWDDGEEVVDITEEADLVQEYTFPISELLEGCNYGGACLDPSLIGACFAIDVFASYEEGSSENNGRTIAFQKPPEASIGINNGPYCVGDEITLTNNTCPGNDPEMTYLWTLPDGTTTEDVETTFILTEEGSQSISLRATNSCGSSTAPRPITVIGLPDVNAIIDTGAFEISPQNYRVCLNGNSTDVLFTTPGTVNTITYQWTGNGSGFQILGPSNNDSLSVRFTQGGDFSFTLTGSNGCATNDEITINVEVIVSEVLRLNDQPDACPSLSYTPNPLDTEATYEINGTVYAASDFPLDLSPSGSPYQVVARKETECRNFEETDEFTVVAAVVPTITSPASQTAYCSDTTLQALVVDVPGGRWTSATGLVVSGDQASFDLSSSAGNYTFTYTVGNGDCERSTSIELSILATDILTLDAQSDACPMLSYTPSPLDPAATYEINGTAYTSVDFPLDLAASATPYSVRATKMTDCGDFELFDEFVIDAAVQPVITTPANGMAFCPDTSTVTLQVDVPNGTWTPAPGLLVNGDQAAFDLNAGAGDYSFTYTVGSGDCERSVSINLSINDQVISLPPPFEVCATSAPVPLNVNPTGGTITGDGIADPDTYFFDPAGLTPGDYELVYNFLNDATGCNELGSFTVTVVAEPTLEVGPPIEQCNTTTTLLLSEQSTFTFTPPDATFSYSGQGVVDPATGAYVPVNVPVGSVDTVLVTYENLPGCRTTDSLLVAITDIILPEAGADTILCAGSGTFFLGNPQGGEWTGNGAAPDGTVNLGILSPGDYTYTLTLDPGGLCQASDQRTVTIAPGDGVGLATDQVYVCDTATTVSLPFANPVSGSWSGDLPFFDNEIEVAGAETGDYEFVYLVTSLPAGCNSENFTLSILPRPTVGLTSDTLGCAGVDCLDFSATGTPADTYTWDFGDGNSESDPLTCHTYANAGTYQVTLDAIRLHPETGVALCSAPTVSAEVLILEPPLAVGIQASTDTVCPGERVILNRSTVIESDFLEYVWERGDVRDTVADLGAITFPSPLEDTTYTIYLETLNPCGDVRDSIKLVVRANPVARIGVVYDEPCSGSELFISNLSSGTLDGSFWVTSDGQSFGTFQPPVLTPFTDSLPRELLVELIVENTCRLDTTSTIVTIQPTDVRALPSFTDTAICFGDPFVVTNISTPGAAYELVFSDGNVYNQDTVSHLFAAPGDYEFTAYAEGCGFDSSNWNISVLPPPTLLVEAPETICPYVDFEYALSGNGSSFNFNLAGLDSTDIAIGSYVFPFLDTTITLVATTVSAAGCRNDSTLILRILPQPTAIAEISDSVCAGAPVELNSIGAGGSSCRWDFGDGQVGDGCSTSHEFAETGLYTTRLIVTSPLGCTDTVANPVFVQFSPTADFDLTYDATNCGPVPVQITTLTNPALASSYEYDLGDGNSSTMRDFVHTYFLGGELTISLRVGWNGVCFDTSSQQITLKKRPQITTLLTDERCEPTDFARLDVVTTDPTDMSLLFGPEVVQNGVDRFEFNVPGNYEWEVTSEDGCDTSGVFFLPEKDAIVIQTVPDATLELGNSILLTTLSNVQALNWSWTEGQFLSDSTIASPVASPLRNTTFFVTATDSAGCFARDTVTISVSFENPVFVPNAISPNEDGSNDQLWIFMKPGVTRIDQFQIFDRWGEMVYSLEEDPNLSSPPIGYTPAGILTWDGRHRGKTLNPQVLLYVIVYLDERGETQTDKGSITLLR